MVVKETVESNRRDVVKENRRTLLKRGTRGRQEAYAFSVPLFGEGVIYGAEPDRRTEQIKLVTSSLHTTALANYVPMMIQEVPWPPHR